MGFCSCINKTFLIILNFIIFAVGVGVIALASLVIHRSSEYGQLLLDGVLTLPIWTLIVGIIITLLGFFGCCGAAKESRCMLCTYAFIVTALFLAEVVLGILVALYPEKAAEHLRNGMTKAFEKYGREDDSLSRAIDTIQHDLKCCGVNGPKDWSELPYGQVPQSCCLDKSRCVPSDFNDLYPTGCFVAIAEDLQGITIALGITAIVLAIVQMVCICIACALAQKRSQYV